MTLDPRIHPKSHRVRATQSAGLHSLTKPQTHRHRRIPPEAPTAQPPTTSLQIPSPHNHKLTTESEETREERGREGEAERKVEERKRLKLETSVTSSEEASGLN